VVVSRLHLDGVRRLRRTKETIEATESGAQVDFSADDGEQPATISGIELEPDTLVDVKGIAPGEFSVTLSQPPSKLVLNFLAGSTLNTNIPGHEQVKLDPKGADRIAIDYLDAGVVLRFAPRSSIRALFKPAKVSGIQFSSGEPATISGLRAARLEFPVEAAKMQLSPGDSLILAGPELTLTSLSLDLPPSDTPSTPLISFNVTGHVETADAGHHGSVLPTWYDKLAQMPAVQALAGLGTLFAGIQLFMEYRRSAREARQTRSFPGG
jgi:hypothetical protein